MGFDRVSPYRVLGLVGIVNYFPRFRRNSKSCFEVIFRGIKGWLGLTKSWPSIAETHRPHSSNVKPISTAV